MANQNAPSSRRIWASVRDSIVPLPFVVRFSVVSCETTTLRSFVTPTSSSSMSAPALTERLNAYSVFEGNSSSPPWCAMLSTRRASHGLSAAAAGAAGSEAASASRAATGRDRRTTPVWRRASAIPAGSQNAPVTDLDTAVDQLQAVPLEDFVAERKRLAKELRGAGERESAAQLAKLPKPSAPAWALNQLAREEPELVGEWLDAAEALRDASARADRSSGDALRAAMTGHRDATKRLVAARPRPRPPERPQALRADARPRARAAAGRDGRPGAGRAAPRRPRRRGRRGGAAGSRRRRLPPSARRRSRTARAAKDRETRAEKERAEREAKARAELERLVAEAEERLAELHEAAEERGAAAEQAEERLEEARRTLHRSESEAAAALQAAEEAAEAVEQGERELRTLNAKLSS